MLDTLLDKAELIPTAPQKSAMLHTDGPLFLMAGPGSGKTRVLLWRTLNLIVNHGVSPDEIFLSTFTEKAAHQLREGLQGLLAMASNVTGETYDICNMYIGTVHSLCQRLATDRRFAKQRERRLTPSVMDALDQYFHLHSSQFWKNARNDLALPENVFEIINGYLAQRPGGYISKSKHTVVTNCISLFNRFSEEHFDHYLLEAKADGDEVLEMLAKLYRYYINSLDGAARRVDFSLLQQAAYDFLCEDDDSGHVFKHVIIDEYQDTNVIQEKIFFKLAEGHKNICVVGDDDQALYRFRGATVENFVQFPERCQQYLDTTPKKIKLSTNFRSRANIVNFYLDFIDQEDWVKDKKKNTHYRLIEKDIKAHSKDDGPAVVASSQTNPLAVSDEIAQLVKKLIDDGKVSDPNRVAFLYPSLKSTQVPRMIAALDAVGLKAYAPRAGRFLECEEPTRIVGLFVEVFGKPAQGDYGGEYADFHGWLDTAKTLAKDLIRNDANLKKYIEDLKQELITIDGDYQILLDALKKNGWDWSDNYDPDIHKRVFYSAAGLSDSAKRGLGGKFLDRIARKRITEGNPFTLKYLVNRATSPDWNVLDLFYRFCGFDYFKEAFTLAEKGEDEGPICNLSLTSQYLARFLDKHSTVITGSFLDGDKFQRTFFSSYLYAIYRLGESEYEDADDPFPKGRIPFITVHQAKGLEFPVVVLGSPRKDDRGPQPVEKIVRPFLDGDPEPLDRLAGFDIMRMFYVALSRAQNLLVITNPRGRGIRTNAAFKTLLDGDITRIPDLDTSKLPVATEEEKDISKPYYYTTDYLMYNRCPRQYMVFNKYGFVPSRSQSMFFGSLVHLTIEDLHNRLIADREVS